MDSFFSALRSLVFLLHRLTFFSLVCAALAMLGYTLLCALGVLPWLVMPLSFGPTSYAEAGVWLQSGVTALLLMLLFFVPSTGRVLRLENSHRSFQIGMQDVAQAYHMAHAADRAGSFQLASEFDSVRERLVFLRSHPDLGHLEPEVLEAAAQMSHISKELAETYSDEALARARSFLRQRQDEVARFNARLGQAKQVANELKHWLHEVELEESVAASQLERLRDELHRVMPELGKIARLEFEAESDSLTRLPRAAE